MWKVATVSQFKVLSRYLTAYTEENHKRPVRTAASRPIFEHEPSKIRSSSANLPLRQVWNQMCMLISAQDLVVVTVKKIIKRGFRQRSCANPYLAIISFSNRTLPHAVRNLTWEHKLQSTNMHTLTAFLIVNNSGVWRISWNLRIGRRNVVKTLV
jgi:hypothetical protein